jgi:hypothetical protein
MVRRRFSAVSNHEAHSIILRDAAKWPLLRMRFAHADDSGAERRPLKLLELYVRQLIGTRRIEGRIGEEPETVDFNQCGRAADQRDRERRHRTLLS